MFLAADIGNSNIVLGIHHQEKWIEVWRLKTDTEKRAPDYVSLIRSRFVKAGILPYNIEQSMVASVVPDITKHLTEGLKQLLNIEPVLLTPDIDTGILLETDRPEEVGPDLIAGAVGGYHAFQETCVVVDFGTATTLTAVENPGMLSGVAICAGLEVSIEALVGKTAQLQNIPLKVPASPLGKNTVEAMQSGLVLGHLCMVEGLIDRIKKEIGAVLVVATGGLVSMLAPHTGCFDYVEPMLTLNGLRIIAERHRTD